jgi:hypothetical protein
MPFDNVFPYFCVCVVSQLNNSSLVDLQQWLHLHWHIPLISSKVSCCIVQRGRTDPQLCSHSFEVRMQLYGELSGVKSIGPIRTFINVCSNEGLKGLYKVSLCYIHLLVRDLKFCLISRSESRLNQSVVFVLCEGFECVVITSSNLLINTIRGVWTH